MKKKTKTKLKLSDDSFTNDQSKILKEQMHFYKTLYTSTKYGTSTLNDPVRSFTENVIPLENDDM